jgi:adenylate cyclase class 2
MTEIEAKFFLGGETIARRLARAWGLVWKNGEFEVNRIFDFSDKRLKKRGALVRLRTRGERAWLTFKEKAISEIRHAKVRIENETELSDTNAAAAILDGLGLQEALRYERYRAGYERNSAKIEFDLMPGGWFCEIEGDPESIDSALRDGQLDPETSVTWSYPEIFAKLQVYNRVVSTAWSFNLLKESNFRIPPRADRWWAEGMDSR